MKITLDKIISTGLLALAVFTALAHGTVEPWSELIFVLSVALLCLLWAIKAINDKRLSLFIPANLWPLAGLILLGLAQSLMFQTGTGSTASLSLDVEATRGTTLLLVCLLLASLMASNFLTHRQQLQTMMQFLTVFGLVLATFSLVQYFTWNDKFYWMRAVQAKTSFGPFVNRNHFAGYMELLLPWPVALMLTRRRSAAEKSFYLFITAWIILVTIFSLSRGGMISIFAQVAFLMIFRPRQFDESELIATRRSRMLTLLQRGAAVAGVLVIIVGGLTWLGAERVVDRVATGLDDDKTALASQFSDQSDFGGRDTLWKSSLKIFRAHPLTGAGLGSFETALPIYDQSKNVGLVASQAHNDYLQTLTDTGLIGGLLAIWFLLSTGRAVMKGLQVHEQLMSHAALGCGASVFGLLVHSLFDFNLQLLSHSLLFLAFAAVAAQLSELAKLITLSRVRG